MRTRNLRSLRLAAACRLVVLMSAAGARAALVGHWPLDEGVGTTVADLSPGGHHGTLVNSRPDTYLAIGVNSLKHFTAFKGTLDDVRLYDVALGPDAIQALYGPECPLGCRRTLLSRRGRGSQSLVPLGSDGKIAERL